MVRKYLSAIAGAIVAAVFTTASGPAQAQDWTGQVTVYGWGAGVGGDFTPFTGAPTLSFDNSLSEVLEDLDAAFFATSFARRDDFVLVGDLTYSEVSRDGLVPPSIPARGEVTLTSLTLAAGKRLDVVGDTTYDVLAGIRGWKVDGLVSVPMGGIDRAPEKTFVDPIVALRVNSPFAENWSVLSYVDLGGFGVGSELTWQAAVTANYQVTDNLYLSLGYRHLYLDYRDGGTKFEGSMAGPLIGATWRF